MVGLVCFIVAAILFFLLGADVINGANNDDIFEISMGLVATGLALWDRFDAWFRRP